MSVYGTNIGMIHNYKYILKYYIKVLPFLQKAALITMLLYKGSEPICSTSYDTTDVVENDTLTISCEVNYTSNVSPMLISWTDTAGQPVTPSTEVNQLGSARSEITIRAVAPSVLSYNSFTYFSAPLSLPTSATNTPAYVYNWTSEVITVQCENITILLYNFVII